MVKKKERKTKVQQELCAFCDKEIGHVKHCPYCNNTGRILPK